MTIKSSEPINLGYPQDECSRYCGTKWDREIDLNQVYCRTDLYQGEARFGANNVEVGYHDQTQSKPTPSQQCLDEPWNDFKTDARSGKFAIAWGAFLSLGMMLRKPSACCQVESGPACF